MPPTVTDPQSSGPPLPSPALRAVYNALFAVGFCISAPFYFLKMWRRGDWRQGFGQRFGRYASQTKHALTNRHVLWFHAVSVGEVNLCTQLIQAIESRFPNLKIVVSTTTSTGMGELRKKLPSHIEKVYYPVDLRRFVRRAIAVLHPQVVVLVEAEIWPNFLWQLRREDIPVLLVNARLSQRSFRGYRRFAFLFQPLFASFHAVGAQNEADAARLRELGCSPGCIRVVGNLKFDAAPLDERRLLDVPALLRQLGVPEGAPVLLGGSTHPGEETLLAEIAQRLKPEFPDLFLILVPRHFERGREVGAALQKLGVRFFYRNEITPATQLPSGSLDCLLVNTTGELRHFYSHAEVVFVGKSLTAQGGQSPIEPGAQGRAMVFGPHMQNFASIAADFVQRDAAVQVPDSVALEAAVRALLQDPARRLALGRNACEVVRSQRGAVGQTVDMIAEALGETGLPLRSQTPNQNP